MSQKNFGKPVEWGMVKDHPWSTPQLRKLDMPASPAMILPWSCQGPARVLPSALSFCLTGTTHCMSFAYGLKEHAHAVVNTLSEKARCASQPCLVA